MYKQCVEVYEILDSALVSGETVSRLFTQRGVTNITVKTIQGKQGRTDFIRAVIPGTNGRCNNGDAPTIGIIGRLGGLGARPDISGFVSDGDGALCALSAGLKIADMAAAGDRLNGDVVICTHICPDAPTIDHEPVRLMGSPVQNEDICKLETEYPMDAILSIDTTKGNRILCHRGFAVTPTVKEGYILRVSETILDIMSRVTGKLPVVLPITTQDITPYGNGIFHINSIMQPAVLTDAPVIGVGITSEVPVAGCATGATQPMDIESASRFVVEVAKDYTAKNCQFYDAVEFELIQKLYGSMKKLQGR